MTNPLLQAILNRAKAAVKVTKETVNSQQTTAKYSGTSRNYSNNSYQGGTKNSPLFDMQSPLTDETQLGNTSTKKDKKDNDERPVGQIYHFGNDDQEQKADTNNQYSVSGDQTSSININGQQNKGGNTKTSPNSVGSGEYAYGPRNGNAQGASPNSVGSGEYAHDTGNGSVQGASPNSVGSGEYAHDTGNGSVQGTSPNSVGSGEYAYGPRNGSVQGTSPNSVGSGEYAHDTGNGSTRGTSSNSGYNNGDPYVSDGSAEGGAPISLNNGSENNTYDSTSTYPSNGKMSYDNNGVITGSGANNVLDDQTNGWTNGEIPSEGSMPSRPGIQGPDMPYQGMIYQGNRPDFSFDGRRYYVANTDQNPDINMDNGSLLINDVRMYDNIRKMVASGVSINEIERMIREAGKNNFVDPRDGSEKAQEGLFNPEDMGVSIGLGPEEGPGEEDITALTGDLSQGENPSDGPENNPNPNPGSQSIQKASGENNEDTDQNDDGSVPDTYEITYEETTPFNKFDHDGDPKKEYADPETLKAYYENDKDNGGPPNYNNSDKDTTKVTTIDDGPTDQQGGNPKEGHSENNKGDTPEESDNEQPVEVVSDGTVNINLVPNTPGVNEKTDSTTPNEGDSGEGVKNNGTESGSTVAQSDGSKDAENGATVAQGDGSKEAENGATVAQGNEDKETAEGTVIAQNAEGEQVAEGEKTAEGENVNDKIAVAVEIKEGMQEAMMPEGAQAEMLAKMAAEVAINVAQEAVAEGETLAEGGLQSEIQAGENADSIMVANVGGHMNRGFSPAAVTHNMGWNAKELAANASSTWLASYVDAKSSGDDVNVAMASGGDASSMTFLSITSGVNIQHAASVATAASNVAGTIIQNATQTSEQIAMASASESDAVSGAFAGNNGGDNSGGSPNGGNSGGDSSGGGSSSGSSGGSSSATA